LARYNLVSGEWRIVAAGDSFVELFKDGELYATCGNFHIAAGVAFDYNPPSLLSRLFWDWK
jgi:hypothetical protein